MDQAKGLNQENKFTVHVKSTILHPDRFTALYFTVGVAEECSELHYELTRPHIDKKLATCEAGDVLWYIYALCYKLGDVHPTPVSQATAGPGLNELFKACGELCGSIKKWSRGDKEWKMFRERIQRNVSELLGVLENVSPCTLEEAMAANIEKIGGRVQRGTIKGDGEIR